MQHNDINKISELGSELQALYRLLNIDLVTEDAAQKMLLDIFQSLGVILGQTWDVDLDSLQSELYNPHAPTPDIPLNEFITKYLFPNLEGHENLMVD